MFALGLVIGLTTGLLAGSGVAGLAAYSKIQDLEARARMGAARLRVDVYSDDAPHCPQTRFLGGRYSARGVTVTAWEVLDALKYAQHLEQHGRNFSRREVASMLSRGQYEALRDELEARGFLSTGNNGLPNVWTRGGHALLRAAVNGDLLPSATPIPAPAIFTAPGGQRATWPRAGRG